MKDLLWTESVPCDVCGRETTIGVVDELGLVVSEEFKRAFREATVRVHNEEDCSGKREVEPYRRPG